MRNWWPNILTHNPAWSCPSAGSKEAISHTCNQGGPHQSPQTTRDTPKTKEHFLSWFLENTESSRHPFKLQQTIFNCVLSSLYKGLSVHPLVGSSMCLSVGLSIRLKCMLSIGQNLTFCPFKLTENEQKWLIIIHVYCTFKHRNNNDHHHRNDYNNHNYNETTKKGRRIFVCLPNLFL